jgi:hypothetical protein
MSVLSKFVRGAATFGAQSLNQLGAAEILKMRDERLNSYDGAARKDTQAFQSKEREAGQKFTQEENDRQRTLTRQENAADRASREREGNENRALDQQRIDIAARQAEQVIASGELEAEEKRTLLDLKNAAIDPELSEAERATAVDNLETYLGDNNDRFSPLYVDQVDETGYPTGGRDTMVLNTGTGEVTRPSAGALGRQSQYQTPDDIRRAYQSGRLTKEEAENLLDSLNN